MANCHQVAGSPSGKWDLPGGEWLPRDKIVVLIRNRGETTWRAVTGNWGKRYCGKWYFSALYDMQLRVKNIIVARLATEVLHLRQFWTLTLNAKKAFFCTNWKIWIVRKNHFSDQLIQPSSSSILYLNQQWWNDFFPWMSVMGHICWTNRCNKREKYQKFRWEMKAFFTARNSR